MPAEAVPLASVPLTACTVIVSTWLLFTAFVSVGGLISIHPSPHFFNASLHGLAPAAVHTTVFSLSLLAPLPIWPSTEMLDVACTLLVPVTAEVIVTWQDADAAP